MLRTYNFCRQLEREVIAATDDAIRLHKEKMDLWEQAKGFSQGCDFQLEARTAETLDAERYRYLRDAAALDECGPSVVSGCGDLFEYLWGAEVDDALDEAMAAWKAKGSPMPKVTK